MSLHSILRSGYVRRFHAIADLAHVGDTVAHHHALVAQILCAAHPAPPADLIRAALHHDCGEMMVGDLPGPFKDAAPVVARQHEAWEQQALDRMGLSWSLTAEDKAWLAFADRLAAFVHVRHVAPHVLEGDDWPAARIRLWDRARLLGAGAVEALIDLRVAR